MGLACSEQREWHKVSKCHKRPCVRSSDCAPSVTRSHYYVDSELEESKSRDGCNDQTVKQVIRPREWQSNWEVGYSVEMHYEVRNGKT